MLNLKYRKLFMSLPVENLLKTTGSTYGTNEYQKVGQQSDFSEYKAYERGDALKDVDWKVVARREKIHVKRYSSEHAKNVYLYVDSSRSMGLDFDGQKTNKKNMLVQMLGYFLDYLMMHKERFSLSFLEDPSREGRTKSDGAGTLIAGQKAFYKARDLVDNFEPFGEINLTKQMAAAAANIEPYSNVFLFSDFYVEYDNILVIKNFLSKKKSHLHLMHFIDKDELSDSKFRGEVDMTIDSETNDSVLFDWNRQWELYRSVVAQHIEKFAKISSQENIDYHRLETSMDPLNLFIGLFNA